MNDLTFCQYRLPCGHCERLDRKCPYISGSNYFNTSPLTPPYILTRDPSTPSSELNGITSDVAYDVNSLSTSTSCSELHPNSYTTATNNLEKGS